MARHYSDPTRATETYALPDLETFEAYPATCPDCDRGFGIAPDYYGIVYPETCPDCGRDGITPENTAANPHWYYWYCFPGCMPDSDPIGPFDTEADALADARADA